MPKNMQRWLLATTTALLIVHAVVAAPAGAERLQQQHRDGFLVWLHSLESTVQARAEHRLDEAQPAYPFGLLGDLTVVLADSSSLLTVARVLDDLESRPRLLQEPSEKTALHAITRARNYRHIAEYDTALAWYDEARRRDTSGEFQDGLLTEVLATAVAASDSVRVGQYLDHILVAADLSSHAIDLELAHRFLIARGDTSGIDALNADLGGRLDALPPEVVFWHAFALSWRGRWGASLDQLLELVRHEGRSLGLGEAQRTWVLVAIADQLVITGHRGEAAPLYRALAESGLPGAADWARCQAAVMDFLDGQFLDAGTALEAICKQRQEFPWRSYACAMSQLSDEMERLRSEGTRHGVASHFER